MPFIIVAGLILVGGALSFGVVTRGGRRRRRRSR